MFMVSQGKCTVKCTLKRDVLIPGQKIELEAEIDNQHCSRKVLRYTFCLLKRILVMEPGKSKPLYQKDRVLIEEQSGATCDAG